MAIMYKCCGHLVIVLPQCTNELCTRSSHILLSRTEQLTSYETFELCKSENKGKYNVVLNVNMAIMIALSSFWTLHLVMVTACYLVLCSMWTVGLLYVCLISGCLLLLVAMVWAVRVILTACFSW